MKQAKVREQLVLGLLALLLCAGNAHAGPCQNNLPPSNPDSVYTDHGNGTVKDTRTKLMWKQCAEGLSGAACQTGSAQNYTWAQALAHAEGSTFANFTDWRLPNVKELSSLVEDCREAPAINTHRFPNTPDALFWSSSPTLYSNAAWSVGFNFGYADEFFRSFNGHVRLVRGGQSGGQSNFVQPTFAEGDPGTVGDGQLISGTSYTIGFLRSATRFNPDPMPFLSGDADIITLTVYAEAPVSGYESYIFFGFRGDDCNSVRRTINRRVTELGFPEPNGILGAFGEIDVSGLLAEFSAQGCIGSASDLYIREVQVSAFFGGNMRLDAFAIGNGELKVLEYVP